jgi:LysR family hydrogen peroxide-inducible transcriptional activator
MKLLPSLKQLEYLDALDSLEHFGKAAERCNVTPSTLSAGIKDLEELMGVPLAERTKRHVMMTPMGRELARRARFILRDAEDLMALVAAQKSPLSGPLSLGIIPTISPYLLPNVLPQLHRDYPDLRLYLREEQTDRLLAGLRNGTLDAAIIALPYDIGNLAVKDMFEDAFLFACPPNHPLAAQKAISTLDLATENMMLLEEGHCLRGHALEICQLSDRSLSAEFEATSLPTLTQMVAAGLGVTLLPQIAINAGLTAAGDLQLIPLKEPSSRSVGLVWRRASPREKEFALLADLLTPNQPEQH